jgi:hypothetical protein
VNARLRPMLLLCLALAAPSAFGQPLQESPSSTEIEEAVPGPPPPLPDLTDPNSRTGEASNEPGSRSSIPKTLRGSASKAGGPANDLNPGGQAEEASLPRGDLSNVLTGKELFHGNYCGAGQRGEGLPPTDALDAACMHHDACYDTAGYRACSCDQTLKREAGLVAEKPSVPLEVRRRALSVVEAAGLMECKAP